MSWDLVFQTEEIQIGHNNQNNVVLAKRHRDHGIKWKGMI